MDLIEHRKRINKALAKLEAASENVRQEQRAFVEAENQITHTQEARDVLQHIAQSIQQQAHSKIATIVSRCLESVFDEPYTFQIQFDRKRGKTEARLIFLRGEMEVDPLLASGGGVVDVAAFALRLACLVLARPQGRRLLVLDEPFKFLSEDHRPRIKSLLETLSVEMGVQFVVVTHIRELEAGTVIPLP